MASLVWTASAEHTIACHNLVTDTWEYFFWGLSMEGCEKSLPLSCKRLLLWFVLTSPIYLNHTSRTFFDRFGDYCHSILVNCMNKWNLNYCFCPPLQTANAFLFTWLHGSHWESSRTLMGKNWFKEFDALLYAAWARSGASVSFNLLWFPISDITFSLSFFLSHFKFLETPEHDFLSGSLCLCKIPSVGL